MSVKNYLVYSLYNIKPSDYNGVYEATAEVAARQYDEYRAMYELSKASFEKNLNCLDDVVLFSGEDTHIQNVFRGDAFRIYDMWKNEPCNILFCGLDTLCIKETDIFDRFDDFMMFNYTEAGPKLENGMPAPVFGFDHYFNAHVRYYPHTMSSNTWDIGMSMVNNWDYSEWGMEQHILNSMLWSQDVTFNDAYRPELAWQGIWDADKNGGVDIEDANIIHFHATRGAESVLDRMRRMSESIV